MQDKVALITKSLRRIWPKYDTDLDQLISETPLILRCLEHAIQDSDVSLEFKSKTTLDERSLILQDLIYQEAGVDIAAINGDQVEKYRIDSDVSLNQMQIINVIKRFLDDPEAASPAVDLQNLRARITPGDFTPLKRQAGDL